MPVSLDQPPRPGADQPVTLSRMSNADRYIAGLEIELGRTQMKLDAATRHKESGTVEALSFQCARIRQRIELVRSLRSNMAR
jgi:hypothetical protein